MPLNTVSLFDRPRLLTSTTPVHDKERRCNFITFLATAQKLRIPFLPITWQPERQSIGLGGSSQIHQALMTLDTSFAFKRVADKEKFGTSECDIFHRCISEIVILWHPAIRRFPKIVELQGICWDIPPRTPKSTEPVPAYSTFDAKVWPVLVFEKSHFGDLYEFGRSSVGRGLGISDRLKICVDIGSAIAHMHSNYIIHGDVKPQNVLIYQRKDGSFTAKVADFGCSVRLAQENARIVLPQSCPWFAPECNKYPDFTFTQAVRADLFSYGVLCLWFIFEEHLSGLLPFPRSLGSVITPHAVDDDKYQALKILESVKKNDSLPNLANELVMAESSLDAKSRHTLQNFFSRCLANEPQSRDIDIRQSFISAMQLDGYSLEKQPITQAGITEVELPQDHEFKLTHSLNIFYLCDYRLRSYILECLEERVKEDPTNPICAQLAYCYELGFGCPAREKLKFSTQQNQQALKHFKSDSVTETVIHEEAGASYRELFAMGFHSPLDLARSYREHNVLEEAEIVTRKDLANVQHTLGPASRIIMHLKSIIISILSSQGRWHDTEKELMGMKIDSAVLDHSDFIPFIFHGLSLTYQSLGQWQKAEQFGKEAVEASVEKLGYEHSNTQNSMHNLAIIYRKCAKWDKAEKLEVRLLDIRRQVLGNEHPQTLSSMHNLASLYSDRGLWQEAERLQVIVKDTRKMILGLDHPSTLVSMANLALTYQNQGQLEKAKTLQIEAMESSQRILGQDHPGTQGIMHNMVLMLWNRGRWQDAENLATQLLETSKMTLGEDHPDTLACIHNLAYILRDQGRIRESEVLMVDLVKKSAGVFGLAHPSTLANMTNLVLTYRDQGRLQEAEKLGLEVVKTSKSTIGHEHPSTLAAIANLASIYRSQTRLKEAEKLEVEVMESNRKRLGEEHPDTLTSIMNLASTLREKGQLEEARELQTNVMEISRRTLPDNHPDTLTSMENLALTIWKQGRIQEARELQREVVDKSKVVFGQDHPFTSTSIANLATMDET